MKYLLMVYSNATSLAAWEGLSDEQRAEFGLGHMALTKRLAASGELIASEGLADQAVAKRVNLREGRMVVSDGPFAEVKEHLAGFYLVECETVERALELAAEVPDAAYNGVEVRPVLDLSEMAAELDD